MLNDDLDRLTQYANSVGLKVLTSQSDLDPKDRALPEMVAWCRQQGNIVVLKSRMILSNAPMSREVQNCKIVMRHQGFTPGRVMPAVSSLIQLLLTNVELPQTEAIESKETFSDQQKRLRILVREALQEEASDIHLEVRRDLARIRFRRHGQLYLHAEWLPHLGREISSVAFNKETDHAVSHFNPLVPQNASMPLIVDGKEIRLRLASVPAHDGFDVVMRILTMDQGEIPTLSELGYLDHQIDLIKKAVSLPYGAVIVSGPTGSGKTTTLASCMQLVQGDRKVYTIEDPVEKVIRQATQVPINTEHSDRGFASMGRAALRMDPDIIVLGEMRDEDTATVMTRAAITGHLVFSTLHTNTASAIVTRLVDMKISPALLSDPNLLSCLICQRLVPTLCRKCAVGIGDSKTHQAQLSRWQAVLGDLIHQVRIRGNQRRCEGCRGLGVQGRTVVAEIIWVDDAGREFIQQQNILGWEKYLKQNGWQTYLDHAIQLIGEGVCDPMDAEKIVGLIDSQVIDGRYRYGAHVRL